MEAKFFSEIEKKMDVKSIKEFEKETRKKINEELELMRNKSEDLSRILTRGESEMWGKIRREEYSWLKYKSEKKKKRLFRLIDIYLNFESMIDSVRELDKKLENVKKLKNSPIEEEAKQGKSD